MPAHYACETYELLKHQCSG